MRAEFLRQGASGEYKPENFRIILLQMKQAGYISADAVTILELLRAEINDTAKEDYILEILDIAASFCSPHLRVW